MAMLLATFAGLADWGGRAADDALTWEWHTRRRVTRAVRAGWRAVRRGVQGIAQRIAQRWRGT